MKRKIFLSVPMSGRENVNIANSLKQMKKVLLAMYPNDVLEFYDNFENGLRIGNSDKVRNTKYPALYYLGSAVMEMGNCEYIATIESPIRYNFDSKGCQIEEHIAHLYYGQMKFIRLSDPDGSIYLPDLKEQLEEARKLELSKGKCRETLRSDVPDDPLKEDEINY